MNYGRRTTNTTTHRDTPLSRTPEPRNTMFQELPEVTVRSNAKPLSLKTVSAKKAGKDLEQQNRMYKTNYPIGMFEYSADIIDKKNKEQAKKKNRKDIVNVLGVTAGAVGLGLLKNFVEKKQDNY